MDATVVSEGRTRRLSLTVGLMGVGALLGALVGFGVEFLLSLGDFSGIFGIASRPGEPIGILIMTGIGLLLGIVAAATIIAESPHIEVSDRDIHLRWKGAHVRVRKDLITAIHLGEDLVLYCRDGTELARVGAVNPQVLRCTLIHHGYPTPSPVQLGEEDFTSDLTLLDDTAQRIIRARMKALRAGNSDIAEILRRQLVGMGVMTRDLRVSRISIRTEFRRLQSTSN